MDLRTKLENHINELECEAKKYGGMPHATYMQAISSALLALAMLQKNNIYPKNPVPPLRTETVRRV